MMNKFGIPVFEATVENLDEGIMAISLVDFPAVESNFLVFKEQKQIVSILYIITLPFNFVNKKRPSYGRK